MLVLNLDEDLEEEEEEIFFVGVRRRKKRSKIRRTKFWNPKIQRIQPRFDDYFFEDHHSYSYENFGQFHDYDYLVNPPPPSRSDPYNAPDPDYYIIDDPYVDDHHPSHKEEHFHGILHFGTIYRDRYSPPKEIRNPRDFRNFPGIEPGGVKGVNSKLLNFITGRVVEVASVIQDEGHYP